MDNIFGEDLMFWGKTLRLRKNLTEDKVTKLLLMTQAGMYKKGKQLLTDSPGELMYTSSLRIGSLLNNHKNNHMSPVIHAAFCFWHTSSISS